VYSDCKEKVFRALKSKDGFSQFQMPAAAHRQKFGKALDKSQYQCG
jgi:hypothetical protein